MISTNSFVKATEKKSFASFVHYIVDLNRFSANFISYSRTSAAFSRSLRY